MFSICYLTQISYSPAISTIRCQTTMEVINTQSHQSRAIDPTTPTYIPLPVTYLTSER
jgi:hypothetical protein